ncbi:alpha/beta fold hydrolase [Leptospira adleri]|uniref:alpha/beta fold hydrolase n=1 Tax=Leptospira adleri TaxID=2023186 RepID=UPI001082E263|nr:alpha/beta hydrolase [Leptospira adleri]TGM52831.1 alpha/beta hydrolase [Leptospira adleri]
MFQIGSRKKIFLILSFLFLFHCGWFVETIPPGKITDQGEYDRFIKLGEINFHYQDFPGTKGDIFLLHGFGSSTYTWKETIPHLRKSGYRIVTLDMKGFGWSDKPMDGDYRVERLQTEVATFLRTLKLKNVIFVGNSLGGAIAALTAAKDPDLVEKLVLIDAVAPYEMEKPLIIRMSNLPLAAETMKTFYGKWLFEWNLKEVVFDPKTVTDERIGAYFDRLRTLGGIEATVSFSRTFLKGEHRKEFLELVPNIMQRTLILWGKEDAWIPLSIGEQFHKDIRNSEWIVFENCGHIPQEEFPEKTANLILKFISK